MDRKLPPLWILIPMLALAGLMAIGIGGPHVDCHARVATAITRAGDAFGWTLGRTKVFSDGVEAKVIGPGPHYDLRAECGERPKLTIKAASDPSGTGPLTADAFADFAGRITSFVNEDLAGFSQKPDVIAEQIRLCLAEPATPTVSGRLQLTCKSKPFSVVVERSG